MTSKVIDVSYYQKDMDYDAVEAAGVQGVIIKISEGCSEEKTWVRHVEECKTRGILGCLLFLSCSDTRKGKGRSSDSLGSPW